MGLSISHNRATLKRPAVASPYEPIGITEEEFSGFNVDFTYFSRYIQKIDCPKVIQTFIIVEQEQYLASTQDLFKDQGNPVLFHTNEVDLQNEIVILEQKYHLAGLEKRLCQGPSEWKLLYYCEVSKQTGFYIEGIGYQSKGMNSRFWERFCSGYYENFALREDFEYAYSCVDYYGSSNWAEEASLRKKAFKKDFIDAYEPGASFMSVSY
jgi:hypothetical protein